nr:replication initiation protein [Moraxella osloensis]
MRALQRVTSHFSDYPQLQSFYDDLPNKPYCSDVKNACTVRPKATASKQPYIQPNHPQIIKWLFIDIDSPLKGKLTNYYDDNLFFRYHDRNLPPPTIIMRNRDNGHVQYAYKLTDPVTMFTGSHSHPIRYLKAIQYALTVQLGGDLAFGGSLAKNPLNNDRWDIFLSGANSYSLGDLAEYLDLTDPANKPPKKSANDEIISPFAGLGRNCDTFDYLRFIAYPIADSMTQTALQDYLIQLGIEFNKNYKQPLLYNEIKCIAKSIARFCNSSRFGACSGALVELKREWGKKGGLKSDSSFGGKARSAKYDDQRTQAKQLKEQGLSVRKIAEQLKVSKTSVQKWLKS